MNVEAGCRKLFAGVCGCVRERALERACEPCPCHVTPPRELSLDYPAAATGFDEIDGPLP